MCMPDRDMSLIPGKCTNTHFEYHSTAIFVIYLTALPRHPKAPRSFFLVPTAPHSTLCTTQAPGRGPATTWVTRSLSLVHLLKKAYRD